MFWSTILYSEDDVEEGGNKNKEKLFFYGNFLGQKSENFIFIPNLHFWIVFLLCVK
jgi:hypothetical protein